MKLSNLRPGEAVSLLSGVVLAVSVFLPWFASDYSNHHSTINGLPRQTVSAWNSLTVLRWLFLLGASAPLVLSWIVVRGHQLSWPRGEVTAIAGVTGFVLVLVAGFVGKPGDPTDTISLHYGWFLALVATLGILSGAVQRTTEAGRVRKPPGAL